MKIQVHPYAVYSTLEVSEILGIKPITVQRYIRTGKLSATRFGKIYKITGLAILELMSLDSTEISTSLDRVRQIENSNYTKSKAYLLSSQTGQQYLNIINLSTATLLAAINPHHDEKDEDQLTIRYIGARIFNTAMASYRDALSGYYQVSFANQRDLIEIQFLLDYFHSFPDKISVWKSSNNDQRIKFFAPGDIRKILDDRDGFTERKRESKYKMFCEYATHMSYTGMKLLTNSQNQVEIGPFMDETKLTNTVHELSLNYGSAVISLLANIKVRDNKTAILLVRHMELFDRIFKFKITEGEEFIKAKNEIQSLVSKLTAL